MNGITRGLWRTGNRVGVWLYRVSGGKVGARSRGGTPVLVLTVRGRTSGKEFSVPVAFFKRSGGYLVVGSGGGTPQEPQWFKNLRAADRAVVQVGSGTEPVDVRVLDGQERDEAFAQVLAENPGFGGYERKSGRPMPVALLTPR